MEKVGIMTTICKTCVHNCNPKGKQKAPIIANKPHAICWCNAEGGRVVTKKYKQCKFYEPLTDAPFPAHTMKTLKEIEDERVNTDFFENYNWFRPVNAKCSKCGAQLYIDDSVVLTSCPPMYQYYCKACGNVETSRIRLNPNNG